MLVNATYAFYIIRVQYIFHDSYTYMYLFPTGAQVDDLNVAIEQQRNAYSNLERKQKKFDASLAEEKATSAKMQADRDQLEKEAREKETKIINMTKQLDDLRDKFAELERLRSTQQKELDEVMATKDDTGKYV